MVRSVGLLLLALARTASAGDCAAPAGLSNSAAVTAYWACLRENCADAAPAFLSAISGGMVGSCAVGKGMLGGNCGFNMKTVLAALPDGSTLGAMCPALCSQCSSDPPTTTTVATTTLPPKMLFGQVTINVADATAFSDAVSSVASGIANRLHIYSQYVFVRLWGLSAQVVVANYSVLVPATDIAVATVALSSAGITALSSSISNALSGRFGPISILSVETPSQSVPMSIIAGKVTLAVANVTAFVADANATAGVAAGIATFVNIAREYVSVTLSPLPSNGAAVAEYRVVVPFTEQWFNPEVATKYLSNGGLLPTMNSYIQAALNAAGVSGSFVVLQMETAAPNTTTTAVISTAPSTTTTAAATSAATFAPKTLFGKVTLGVDNAAAFAADPTARTGVASGLATALGIDGAFVQVKLSASPSRRLADARQLAQAVVVDYSVFVPTTMATFNTASAIVALSSPSVLTNAIRAGLASVGAPSSITVVSVDVPAESTTTTAATLKAVTSATTTAVPAVAWAIAMTSVFAF